MLVSSCELLHSCLFVRSLHKHGKKPLRLVLSTAIPTYTLVARLCCSVQINFMQIVPTQLGCANTFIQLFGVPWLSRLFEISKQKSCLKFSKVYFIYWDFWNVKPFYRTFLIKRLWGLQTTLIQLDFWWILKRCFS